MLFKLLKKVKLKTLTERLLEANNEVIAPVKIAETPAGESIFSLEPCTSFKEMVIDYTKTRIPAKRYFLPYAEVLTEYDISAHDWAQKITYDISPRVIMGLHSCDIAALLKPDKVLLRDVYPSPYYASRRKNTHIVGIYCEPQPECFCYSMNTDKVTHGYDIFLTDLGEEYFVEIISETFYRFLEDTGVSDITPAAEKHYKTISNNRKSQFKTHVDTKGLSEILEMDFYSDAWRKWGERCLSCGSCAMVCPTCYCYGVFDEINLTFSKAQKTRRLYSCNLVDFAEVAGGHNFRPDSTTRLKYRYYHQHRGFLEEHDESKCVGCGRCSLACLAGIAPPEVIEDVRKGVGTADAVKV